MTSPMPAAPIRLPRRAVDGEERNLSAKMKLTDPTSQTRKVAMSQPLSSI
jgi:hypothetical protein